MDSLKGLTDEDPRAIGAYRLLGRLGTGGMGRVYLARSEGGRTVAVKLVRAELAAEREFRDRFRAEVAAARRVGGRWTAPVLDADTDADIPWVATGYIAGPALSEVVDGTYGALPEYGVRRLAYGLSCALLDIHGAGLVHRDLKPSNVLLTIDGPRVIDFGIARALDAVSEHTQTQVGMVVGSPSFMSPEQVRGDRVTPASDVFCLGSVLAYAASGRMPFGAPESGVHAVMFRVAESAPDLDAVPKHLRELIGRCLAKDPEERPAPEDLVSEIGPVSSGGASSPWLPAQLVAQLGQHAVRLLDTDTPPSGQPARPGRTTVTAAAGSSGTAAASSSETVAAAPPETAGGAPLGAAGEGPSEAAGAALPEGAASRTTVLPAGSGSVAGQAGGREASGPYGSEGAQGPHGHEGAHGSGGPSGAAPYGSGSAVPAPRRRRWPLALGAVAVVAAAAGVALFTVPALGGSGESDGGSDIPAAYVGTWTGDVQRDGVPTGQQRRFVISHGSVGEVVANSISLGATYECKSDGKLVSVSDAGGMRLDTTVVGSAPEGRCSALGEHVLKRGPHGTLVWSAAGRTATLRPASHEVVPKEYLGTWQRPNADGIGTQVLTIERTPVGSPAVRIDVRGSGGHCTARADFYSADGKLSVGPSVVERRAPGCAASSSSFFRIAGDGTLVRTFRGDDKQPRAYTKVQ
ncbi:serine/threonine protein kinase [Streptomyces sp. Ru73]|uniref:serine/threonine-protein kinase n=1 Tax=Streptomyces sp. Ru73 TaxID=2080748 RepID=UPI000CDD6298|nr:serine/threonine-protein kinase [Streptomyces sp. Ru73]POX42063.1 serine/threonine protein kinase [Streptomyces sp. Ru73]